MAGRRTVAAAGAALALAGCSAPAPLAERPVVTDGRRTVAASFVDGEPCREPVDRRGQGCEVGRATLRARVLRPPAGDTLVLDAGAPADAVRAWVGERSDRPSPSPPGRRPVTGRWQAVDVVPAGRDGRCWLVRLPRRPRVPARLLQLWLDMAADVGVPYDPPLYDEDAPSRLQWARWEVRLRPQRAGQGERSSPAKTGTAQPVSCTP